MPVVAAIVGVVVQAGLGAYSAYEEDLALSDSEKYHKDLLAQIGVKNDEEKRLLELQVNTADKAFFNSTSPGDAPAPATNPPAGPPSTTAAQQWNLQSVVDNPTLLIGGILVGFAGLKLLKK